MLFQSTRPVRGATLPVATGTGANVVSIHAPRAGRDANKILRQTSMVTFQSTRPARGATSLQRLQITTQTSFNPRAPRGARPREERRTAGRTGFNPRAPCGARRVPSLSDDLPQIVSIHAPRVGRDSHARKHARWPRSFQSTRPVRGATTAGPQTKARHRGFNPRAPCGARLKTSIAAVFPNQFQSTRPARGATSTLA